MSWFSALNPLVQAFLATLFTWGLTALGSALVFFVRRGNHRLMDGLLGISAGIMMAASVFSLIIPSLDASEKLGLYAPLVIVLGNMLGAISLWLLDHFLPHKHERTGIVEGEKSNFKDSTLLFLAITIHNIPEGLAVGVAIGSAAMGYIDIGIALMLALGIGIQNFPEGAAVSLPVYERGESKFKAFMKGQASALVEIPAAIIGALLVSQMEVLLPFAMTFASGAMIYVVVEELIPESQANQHSHIGTMSFMIGFCIMMFLDIALG